MQHLTSYHTSYCQNVTYHMNGVLLKLVEKIKYLGIYLNNKLSWHDHIDYICNKANRLLSFLRWNLHCCHEHFKGYAYKQFLLPSIEYWCTIWDPYHLNDIYKLKIIQHHTACLVLYKPWIRHHDSITEMLNELNWLSLQEHRKQSHLILLCKIVNHLRITCTKSLSAIITSNCYSCSSWSEI